MNLQTQIAAADPAAGMASRATLATGADASPASRMARVKLLHLRTEAEIALVRDMREEHIDLSIHAAAGLQQFSCLEKKETSAVSCSDSSWMVN